ncbi:hypothetical protein I546_1668 [Mycobacterium kansasii 732]|nr:hypothetical protein I546_1668 [Mycobacterium kansasii 732]
MAFAGTVAPATGITTSAAATAMVVTVLRTAEATIPFIDHSLCCGPNRRRCRWHLLTRHGDALRRRSDQSIVHLIRSPGARCCGWETGRRRIPTANTSVLQLLCCTAAVVVLARITLGMTEIHEGVGSGAIR